MNASKLARVPRSTLRKAIIDHEKIKGILPPPAPLASGPTVGDVAVTVEDVAAPVEDVLGPVEDVTVDVEDVADDVVEGVAPKAVIKNVIVFENGRARTVKREVKVHTRSAYSVPPIGIVYPLRTPASSSVDTPSSLSPPGRVY
ncbi:Uncharacterized protein FWK35_00012764 [Aphis craccivora]|uniref:Uncharacterized protein n=1 Tax=Aphis craccivora TaxID=307492 RepID=A0A6G0Y6E3_APHCR|nr:Uncharacterized protein FWK35_00012764 [Aphis craccivora]